jgi:DNA polymerase (family 10)
MELATGIVLSNEVVGRLKPYCKPNRIVVVGSIRRKKPTVHDIDIVLIPSDGWNLLSEIKKLGYLSKNGPKLKTVRYKYAQVDLYIGTEEIWATLLLIRTGSAENNIRLCSLAKSKGWKLEADGDGLFDESGRRLAGDTEESIYQALGLPYQKPEQRG